MEFWNVFLGTDYTYVDYLSFLLFTIIGMTFNKIREFSALKKQNPDLDLKFWVWLKIDSIDFISAFIASFITLRFLGFMSSVIAVTVVGMEVDVMLYGLILGISYQYTFKKLIDLGIKEKIVTYSKSIIQKLQN